MHRILQEGLPSPYYRASSIADVLGSSGETIDAYVEIHKDDGGWRMNLQRLVRTATKQLRVAYAPGSSAYLYLPQVDHKADRDKPKRGIERLTTLDFINVSDKTGELRVYIPPYFQQIVAGSERDARVVSAETVKKKRWSSDVMVVAHYGILMHGYALAHVFNRLLAEEERDGLPTRIKQVVYMPTRRQSFSS